VGRMEQVTVIVTGGGSGIGAACARRLAAEGASVVVTDINSANGRAIVAEIGAQALFVPLDVRDEAAWQTMLDQTQRRGGFGGLVNAAGVAHADDSLDRCTREVWDFTLRVNLDGVFLGTKHAILRMKVRGGSIVNIASVLANAGSADAMAYIRTPMVGPFLASVPGLEAALTARHPLGRLGTAEEVAEVVLFLLSNDSRFVSGASLAVDGGYLAD
jgi:NAD(P)-dependent dehydrogenase (short-subunit alcohol dehydrogenase family)